MKSSLNGRLRKSFEMLGDIKGKKILNVGCKGAWLEKHVFKNKIGIKEMHSFDIKDYKFPKLGKRIKFRVDSVLDMKKYFGANFDIAAFYEVIEHLPKKTELIALQNINKSLKRGGILCLSTPNRSFFSNLLDPACYIMGHRHYSKEQIKIMLNKSGFVVVKNEIKGGFGELFSMIFYYIFKHLLRSRKLGLNLFEKRKEYEYGLDYNGFANIFIVARKARDL